jgi:hypothetical protein
MALENTDVPRVGANAVVPDSPPGPNPTTGYSPTTYQPQQPLVADKSAGQSIDATSFDQMLNVLNELVQHTHIFYDDYSTACNCNCNCACTRGTL